MSKNGVRDFSYFVYILSCLQMLKIPVLYTLVFHIFINNSRSKQNKRNLDHPFVDIIRQMCEKFQQKILKSVVFGAR